MITGAASAVVGLGFPFAGGYLKWPYVIPAWPPNAWQLTLLVWAVVSLGMFLMFRHAPSDRLRHLMRRALPLALAGFVLYVVVSAALTRAGPDYYVVIGFSLTPEIQQDIANNRVPSGSANDLIRSYGAESTERIWTGVPVARTFVGLSYSFFLISVTAWLTLAMLLRDVGIDRNARSGPSHR